MSNLIIKDMVLNENEWIIKTIKQSKIVLMINLILPSIIILLPFFFLFILFSWGNKGIALFFGVLLVGIIFLIRTFIIWQFKAFIITNQRIIDIDQKGFFQRVVSNVPLKKIDDIFYKIKGFWQTISRIGSIYVTLIDHKNGLELKNVASPQLVQQMIFQLKEKEIGTNNNKTNLSAKELVEMINKIRNGIGEKKFNELINEDSDEEESGDEEDK